MIQKQYELCLVITGTSLNSAETLINANISPLHRQVFLIQSPPMAYKEKYLMDVMESLFKLLSFFFHVFRPLVCLVLEHGASLSHDDFILNAKLQSEHKKLLKRDEEN